MAWIYIDTGEIIDEDDGGVITTLDEQVSEEDGLKFAAAPEMYASLCACIEALENPGLDPSHIVTAEARQVIAKASGAL